VLLLQGHVCESAPLLTQPADSLPQVVARAKLSAASKVELPQEDVLLSPASHLRVTRKVGQDGLVIAWLPSTDTRCVGYLICVNGQESQRVRSAQRTKAVLCGLDLTEDMEICIYSLCSDGLISRADCASYSPDVSAADAPAPAADDSVPATPREVVVQTFYTNSSVTVRSSRRVSAASRIPVRSSPP